MVFYLFSSGLVQIDYLKKNEPSPFSGLVSDEDNEVESAEVAEAVAEAKAETEDVVVTARPGDSQQPEPKPDELQTMAEEAAEDVEAYNDRED